MKHIKTLKFAKIFFRKLEENKIEYVHWKSNVNLHNALLGDDDLDILVNPNNKENLQTVFKELNIIRGYSEKDLWQQGVIHYYGIDDATAQIIHIHLHYQLPIGFDYNKNYIIPINDSIFLQSVKLHNVNITCPEHEYILLVLRLMIKNATTPFLLANPIRQIKIIGGAKIIPKNALKEFNHLKNIIDREKLRVLLKNDIKYIELNLFSKCESIIEKNISLVSFIKLANELKRKLKPYRGNTELKSFVLSFFRINKSRLLSLKIKIFGSKVKGSKTPEYGGRIYAFVGGDGAGKSTNIKTLKNKLSQNFKTTTIHVGKPPKSIIGGILYYNSRVLKKIGLINSAKLIMSYRLAIDRKRTFKKAEKLRTKGVIVILDRIPTDGITAMDAPSINPVNHPKLAKKEKLIYSDFKGIDLLFVMKLNPEIALKRRPDDDADNLRIRSGQVWNWNWYKPYQIVTDTGNLNFFEVEQRILKNAWDNLIVPFKKIELVGMSGAGKSTIHSKLKDYYPNSTNVFSKKKYLALAILNSIKNPLGFYSSLLPNQKNINHRIKYNIGFNTLIINKYLMNNNSGDKHLFLDQNIIFSYMLALKEKYFNEEEVIKKINYNSRFFDFIVLLEAPKDLLFERIKTRENQGIGRAKDMNYVEFEEFYTDYQVAFKLLDKTKLKILKIDTGKLTPNEIIETINKQYN